MVNNKVCPVLKAQIERLEERISTLENGCCGYEATKLRVETANSLKLLGEQFDRFILDDKNDWKEVNAKIDKQSKFIYIALGIILTMQFVGVSGIIKIFGE